MKAELHKLDINKFVNVPPSWNNLKTNILDLKYLSNVVSKEAVKNTELNALNTTVDNLGKDISDMTAVIHINQCHKDKQNWRC